jgi:DNA-directed RNA polymerase subunit RPC12/RpoP
MIAFSCSHCGRGFQVPDASAGQSIRCGKCKATLRVPRSTPDMLPVAVAAAAAQPLRHGPAPMPAPPPPPRRVRARGLPAWAWAAIIASAVLLAGLGSLIVRIVR